MSHSHLIENEAQLREVIGEPNPMLEQKVFDHIDDYAAAFIRESPLALLATAGPEGDLDVSPKGDAAGFIELENPKALLLPDRPGNKLVYGFRNILANPNVGLIFVVPGVSETLRVNGRAEITRDPELLERFAARNKPALLITRVHVDECFFHCGKAFIRSSLWKPETWPEGIKANIGKQLANKLKAGDEVAAAIDRELEEDLRTGL